MIYNCDCLIGFLTYEDGSVKLIVTDPPYGVEFKNKVYDDSKLKVFSLLDSWIDEMYRVLEDGSHIYIFIPTLEVNRWVASVKRRFVFKNLLAFPSYKANRYMKNNFDFNLQLVIYASKGKSKRLNKVEWIHTSPDWLNDKRNKDPKEFSYEYPSFNPEYFSNVRCNAFVSKLHPNQKNEELCRYLIELSSDEGDLVLDPFCGSGTVPLAAESVGRWGDGFEKNKEVYELALKRYVERDYLSLKQNETIGDMLEI